MNTRIMVSPGEAALPEPDSGVIMKVEPRLYSRAAHYAASGSEVDRVRLNAEAMRFAARRVRETCEAGSEFWASELERMASLEEDHG